MTQPGQWGFSIKRSKKGTFICISKDGKCEFRDPDRAYIDSLLSGKQQVLSEGVYAVSREFDDEVNLEAKLLNAGFTKDEYRAKTVLDYMKEMGSLKFKICGE